jgi:ribonuclease Y
VDDWLIGAIAGVVLGATATGGLLVWRQRTRRLADAAAAEARQALAQAELVRIATAEAVTALAERERILRDSLAQDRLALQEEQRETESRRRQTAATDERLTRRAAALDQRESALDNKLATIERRNAKISQEEERLAKAQAAITAQREELDQESTQMRERLTAVAGMDQATATAALMHQLDTELVAEQGQRIVRHERELRDRCTEQAAEILAIAIQRQAAELTVDTTTARIDLTDDDLKGRIIGKEGRNIRAFEHLAGVDLIIDETPGVITISCFDGLRREIARRTMLALLADGRISPARIEEVLVRTQQEIDRTTLKLGEDAAFDCHVSGVHPQILRLLGKLAYRTSYGQNVLQHVREAAHLAGTIAAELGLDATLARRCGLLHDLGKAIDTEQEGSHPVLGEEVLRSYGEVEVVSTAARAHHECGDAPSVYTVITAAADAISAARPGARRENVERYLQRLQQIEEIALGFPGVAKAYAISAGREIRVLVDSAATGDPALPKLARDIAKRIEQEVTYHGEVKVTVIRETRQAAYAR